MDSWELGGVPVLGRADRVAKASAVVLVLHGMSTTPETLAEGWPPADDDPFERVYWRLPVLREGRDRIAARRDRDAFLDLFYAVWAESRAELPVLLDALGDRAVGLFGFSIGAFLALWGAVDQRSVRAVAAVGGVPNFDYLTHFYPDYPWDRDDVAAARQESDLMRRIERLANVPTMIQHGEHDDVARWEWMAPLAQVLHAAGGSHVSTVYPAMRHRLVPQSPEEEVDLGQLCRSTAAWFARWLG